MGAVADLFDRNGEGLIDWQEFIAALRPDWQDRKPPNDADKIHDEVKRLVMLCTCRQKFRVFQVGEGKYRVSLITNIWVIWVVNYYPSTKSIFHNIFKSNTQRQNIQFHSLETLRSCALFVFYVVL